MSKKHVIRSLLSRAFRNHVTKVIEPIPASIKAGTIKLRHDITQYGNCNSNDIESHIFWLHYVHQYGSISFGNTYVIIDNELIKVPEDNKYLIFELRNKALQIYNKKLNKS